MNYLSVLPNHDWQNESVLPPWIEWGVPFWILKRFSYSTEFPEFDKKKKKFWVQQDTPEGGQGVGLPQNILKIPLNMETIAWRISIMRIINRLKYWRNLKSVRQNNQIIILILLTRNSCTSHLQRFLFQKNLWCYLESEWQQV